MFIDEVSVKIISWKWGNGLVSWRREKYIPKWGPWGGDGWNGWDVYLLADENINTLSEYRHKKVLTAENGVKGMPNLCHGANGEDLLLKVPVGTLVRDELSRNLIVDLKFHGEKILMAAGWRGGYGNAHFCSSTRQAPAFAELGDISEEKELFLELKLVADIWIIWVPSAGKSTLISKLSNVKPKIWDYPFTTLTPNLGVFDHKGKSLVLEDVPGLIPGASEGKGLGIEFLKHIERTWVLLHLLDLYRLDNVLSDYENIRYELTAFSPDLAQKKEIIVFTKSDLLDEEMKDHIISEFSQKFPDKIFFIISAATWKWLEQLKDYLVENVIPELKVSLLPENQLQEEVKLYNLTNTKEDPKRNHVEYLWDLKFRASGKRLEQIVRMTDFENGEAVMRVYNVLEKMWVISEVQKKLAQILDSEGIDNSFFFEGSDEKNISPKIIIGVREVPLEKLKFNL